MNHTSQTPDPAIVVEARRDEDILATRDLMRRLRPDVPADSYVSTVRRMMHSDGYRLAALWEGGAVRAVAGYRFMEMLYCGRILYVDDLNTDDAHRSRGFGKTLMDWLKAKARESGCRQLHLDSGVQRGSTHRFYFRERLTINAYHFQAVLEKPDAPPPPDSVVPGVRRTGLPSQARER